ncbi:hypothetical protein [Kordia sp.]|uniref:hypothetical protein n=1 Tax=Kordia sp. TaxID=1965332 RepID=UPI003D2D2E55
MKKKALNNLSLNKKTISKLILEMDIKGGVQAASDGPTTCQVCPTPSSSKPDPTPASDPAICSGRWEQCPII